MHPLSRQGADVAAKNAFGRTPLHAAVSTEKTSICTLLLDRGCDANATGEQKTYPHLLVVLAGNASWRLAREAFRSSWSRYAWHRSHIQQLRRARTKFQITATARAGRLGRAKWSGDGPGRRRPQVRVAWDSRSSPFFIPGSSREGVSPSGTPTPSAHTRRPRRPRRVRVSITHVVACLRPPACVAVGRGTPKHLHGCDANATDNTGRTPLYSALSSTALCTLLHKRGCDVTVRDNTGATPLHAAGSASVCALLLDWGVTSRPRGEYINRKPSRACSSAPPVTSWETSETNIRLCRCVKRTRGRTTFHSARSATGNCSRYPQQMRGAGSAPPGTTSAALHGRGPRWLSPGVANVGRPSADPTHGDERL